MQYSKDKIINGSELDGLLDSRNGTQNVSQ